MKKIFLLAIVLFSLNASTIIAQTTVSGGSVSGTWTLAGSPYLIQGSIQIPNDSTLIIQSGVTVNFQGAYKLNVQGRLLAIGTVTDSITFTASNTTNGWRGIRFDNTPATNDTSKIIFCKLQHGKATGTSPNDCGGALYFNTFSKTIVTHSKISNCSAVNGAGIYTIASNPTISYNSINNNSASNNGGGIYSNGNPTISNNSISNNTTSNYGGGIYVTSGSASIYNNTISHNSAGFASWTGGGGIYSNGSPNITNNTISYNSSAYTGGGMYCNGAGIVCNNLISNNTASNSGGGVICFTLTNLSFTKNFISNNTAVNGGGVYYSMPFGTFSDNVICNNTASSNGGGFYCSDFPNSSPNIINSTVTNNSAANGGALYCVDASAPDFRNCILYGNTASTSGLQVFITNETKQPNFYYCDVAGGSAAFEIGGNPYIGIYQNNINTNPLFIAPSGGSGTGFNGLTADWSLQIASPCIDEGEPNGTYPTTDIAGNPRVNVCRIDIGAYEYQKGIPFVVSLSISQQILCNGVATGSISSVTSGGIAPYTYLWSNGQTNSSISGLVAGNYSVTVSETGSGCILIKSITLTQPAAILIDVRTDSTIICGSSVQLSAKPKWVTSYLNSVGQSNTLNSVFFTDTDTGYAVGGNGTILKTSNGGTNWTTLTSGTTWRLSSVYFTDANTGYAVGNGDIMGGGATIIKTINGGTNWVAQTSGATYNGLNSVYFTDANTGYAVGANGTIIKTINGGTNWTSQVSGTTWILKSVYFTDANTGYAVGMGAIGGGGTILKTTNGGANWNAQTSGTTNDGLNSVYFTDANTGIAVGGNGTIIKTINGGTTWTAQSSGTPNGLSSICFTDANTAFAVGDYGLILKTSNGGTNWATQTSGTTAFLSSVYFANANTGFAIGNIGSTSSNTELILNLNIPVSYSWSPANGLNETTISSPIANPTVSTTYIVTATTTRGCTAIDSVNVFVNPLTANAGMDKTIICGGTAQLDNITSNYTGTGVLSYNWSPVTGLNYDTIANPTAIVIQDTKYYVTVSTPNGCIAIDSVIVHVNPLTAFAGMDKTIICGGTAQLDNVTSNYSGTGNLTYSWSPTNGLNDETLPNPTTITIQSTKYYVTVSTPNGCSAIDSVNVFVNPLTITGTDRSIICGDSAMISTTTNYTGMGALTYAWSPSAGLGDTAIANPYVTTISNQQYTVSLITPNGCEASDNVSVSIIPMNAPEICIVGVDSTNKNLIAWNKMLSSAIDSFYIYRETNITNVYQKIGAESYDSLCVFVDINSFPDVQSNKYKLSIKDDCGLESSLSASHKTMHLSINHGMGNTWNLNWEAYEGFTVSTYNIYRGIHPDTLFSIGTSSGSNTSYSDLNAPSGYLYYQVEVVSPNFCNSSKSYSSSRSNIAATQYAGINDYLAKGELFSIYPNPANDKIEISVLQKSQIEFLNADGQVLKRIFSNENNTTIDISEFSKGVYFVKVITEKGIEVKKFIKK